MEQQTIPFNLEYFRAGNKAFVKKEYSGERTIEYKWVADTQRTEFVVVHKSFEETPGSGLWEEQYFAIEIKALENHTYMHPPVFYTAVNAKFGILPSREMAERTKAVLYSNSPSVIIIELTHEQYQAIQEEMNKATKPEQI
jgi:hypothetical protein